MIPGEPPRQCPPRRCTRARCACTARAARARPSSVPRSTHRTVGTGTLPDTAVSGATLLVTPAGMARGSVRLGSARQQEQGSVGTGRATCASIPVLAAATCSCGGPARSLGVLVTGDVGDPSGAAGLQVPGRRGAAPERGDPLLALHPAQPGGDRALCGDGLQPPPGATAQLAADNGSCGGAGVVGAHAAPRPLVQHLQVPAAAAAAPRQTQQPCNNRGQRGHGTSRGSAHPTGSGDCSPAQGSQCSPEHTAPAPPPRRQPRRAGAGQSQRAASVPEQPPAPGHSVPTPGPKRSEPGASRARPHPSWRHTTSACGRSQASWQTVPQVPSLYTSTLPAQRPGPPASLSRRLPAREGQDGAGGTRWAPAALPGALT